MCDLKEKTRINLVKFHNYIWLEFGQYVLIIQMNILEDIFQVALEHEYRLKDPSQQMSFFTRGSLWVDYFREWLILYNIVWAVYFWKNISTRRVYGDTRNLVEYRHIFQENIYRDIYKLTQYLIMRMNLFEISHVFSW